MVAHREREESSHEEPQSVPVKELTYRHQWINLNGPNFSEKDLFYLQAIYGSNHLIKQFVKYREMYPSEDLDKVFDIFYEMDHAYVLSHGIQNIRINLPESARNEEFVKQIASVDENGDSVSIDNLIMKVPASAQWHQHRNRIQNIVDLSVIWCKPVPKDVFVKTNPKTFSADEFEIRIGGKLYQLKTMYNSFKYYNAVQGASNNPYFCVMTTGFSRYGDDAKYMLEQTGWDIFHYQLKR